MFFADNKISFVTLTRILPILTFILLITTAAPAQQNRPATPGQSHVVKVVRFYPNPASSFINFEFSKDYDLTNHTFKIYNFIGKKVLELSNLSPRTVINLTDYFRGVYIFQLTDRNGQIVESGKFQVVK